MGKYHVCYIFLFLVKFCSCALQSAVPDEENKIDECVSKIIQRIELVNTTDVTLVNVNLSLVKLLHTKIEHHVRFISRTYYWPNDSLYNDVYVIYSMDIFQFAYGLGMAKRDPFWNPRAKFIIIIEQLEESYILDVSILLVRNHVFDVAVLTYDDEEVAVYTFGLEHDECDRPAVKMLQLLSRCSEIHNTNKIYVASRKTSLRGCHVKFVSHNYWPFMSFEKKPAIDRYILSLLRQYENITVELVNYGQVERFGSRLDNFTYTGMLHEIESYNVEGAVGGYILNLNRMQNLDFVEPYMMDYYKVIIARAKLLGLWSGVLKQLSIMTVCIVFGIFCLTCVLVKYMETFSRGVKDTSRDVLIVWGYFLGNITHKNDVKTGLPHRILILNILMYVFIVSCATQASLLSATTNPIRGTQPNTAEEVLANYQLILSPNLYLYLKSNPVIELKQFKQTCKVTLDCIVKVMKNDDQLLYTIASDIYHESNIWNFTNKQGESLIKKISISVGTLLQTMYIRRGSSLAIPFNRLLLRARSGGFIDKYLERILEYGRRKYIYHRRSSMEPQSLKGLAGVFIVLFSGYVISAITFILELWFSRL